MTNRLIQILLVFIASCCASLVEAAPVESMSLETFKDGPQRFWEVSVRCEAESQVRLMRRPVDEDQWCSSALATLCDKNKFSLSRQLCSDSYNAQIAKPQDNLRTSDLSTEDKMLAATQTMTPPTSELAPSMAASREDLRKEQMQIEEQRILIDLKRLEIRRRELQLLRIQLEAGEKQIND